ncbi:ATP-binding cassette domain-containing protein [Proteus vulgaris]|uniref:ATP-binding cassette domain-containing protein n=1 Tax=Proteus vulgaris TaxID=585 RepID=UPI0018E45AC7|nr:ATP-binding cassette domain-containing protein [Proteus vulgaris]MBI6530510.1 ATP-binding cassette domain-containing protein [Proteus vulgaris]
MKIYISDAHENNLKHISFDIPHNQITALTGISGSGKSTILRNILAATGAKNYARSKSKSIKDGMNVVDIIKVVNIDNLPQTILIDVVNHVNTPTSTLATISGIHNLIRNLFLNHAIHYCLNCNNKLDENIYTHKEAIEYLVADIIYDASFDEKLEYLKKNYNIFSIHYYDKNGQITEILRKRAYSTIKFKTTNLNEKIIKEVNKIIENKVKVKINDIPDTFNPLLYTVCFNCKQLSPALSKSRFSFNISINEGGGACEHCRGTGKYFSIEPSKIIIDKNKGILNNSICFVSDKGIKYTTVTGKFIEAFLKNNNINIQTPINKLSQLELNLLLFGSDEIISFQDIKGGKKNIKFLGVINYLLDIYSRGQRKEILAPFINECECFHCNGTRIDPLIDAFKIEDNTIRNILLLTISELNDWCSKTEQQIRNLKLLSVKLNNFIQVSCGHLSLNRSSPSLSGGEMQRIKLCSMLNSDLRDVCYLLDEPSSGLHYNDLTPLMNVFYRLKKLGNTIILVEHNKRVLEQCDNIIDIGPGAGEKGGEILFNTKYSNVSDFNTLTSNMLFNEKPFKILNDDVSNEFNKGFFSFENLKENNLKNISINIPYEKITTICGVSGSGKTTLLDKVIFERVSNNMDEFGFNKIVYIKQKGKQKNSLSSIATILGVSEYLAKLFAKNNKVDHKIFSSASLQGKCIYCQGKGIILTKEKENVGICTYCDGKRYDKNTLKYKYNDMDFYTYMNHPMSVLLELTKDSKIHSICQAAIQLGVGYLSFSRNSTTLSKGEFQRVMLINVLSQNETHTLCLLDEPAKGLHYSDIGKLYDALRKIINNGNTIISVEHNLEFIAKSDQIIEIGPSAGKDGGYLIFCGPRFQFNNTTTSRALINSHKQYKKTEEISIADIQNYSIAIDEESLTIKKHEVNFFKNKNKLIYNTYRFVEDLFLKASISNYSNFKFLDDGYKVNTNIPLMINIDFNADKYRYYLSIGEILGVNEYLIHGFMLANPELNSILRYVINPQSSTGKCFKCLGKGIIYSLPRSIFIESDQLSKSCIKFLRNSTSFKEISKYVLNEFNIDWNGKISELGDDELSCLFNGFNDSIIIGNEVFFWNGIIDNAIQHYKYYPDDTISRYINKNKEKIVCPVCSSALLQNEFKNIKYNNMYYSEWLNLSITEIIKKLTFIHPEDIYINKILEIINLLNKLTRDKVSFNMDINELNAQTRGIVQFVSHFSHNIYGTCIIIKNIENLSAEQKEIVENLSIEWIKTNTVIISN